MIGQLTRRLAARGLGRGAGGGGHANNPTLMFGADWQKKKWKGAVFCCSVFGLGCYVPYKCIDFAQKKAGVEWPS